MTLAFPKPGQVRKKPDAVKVFRGGREVLNLRTKDGADEYQRRITVMWERQGKRCGLQKCCSGRAPRSMMTFDHSAGRGHGGGHRDDRIEVDGKWVNMAVCWSCNARKGSMRLEAFLNEVIP